MTDRFSLPSVGVIADVDTTAELLIEKVLEPAGYKAWVANTSESQPDVLVVDVTQLRGDPMAKLQNARERGIKAPAIVLAAHFPISKLRDLFLAGVNDFLVKPYRVEELTGSIERLGSGGGADDKVEALEHQLNLAERLMSERSLDISKVTSFGRAIAKAPNPDVILDRAVEAVMRLLGVELAGAYLVDPKETELALRSVQFQGEESLLPEYAPLNASLAGEVYKTGRAILRQQQKAGEVIEIQSNFNVYSATLVPLVMNEKTVGVLGAFGMNPETRLSEHDANLLRSLSDWCAVAFEQAYLSMQAQSGAQEPAGDAMPVVSQPEPEKAAPSTDSVVVPAVAPDLVDGLEKVVRSLRAMLDRANESGKQALGPLLNELTRIQSLPLTLMNLGQAERLVDIHAVTEEVASTLGQQAAAKKLKLSLRESARLPMWRGDGTRVAYCMEALLTASLDRTNEGEIAVELNRVHITDQVPPDLPVAEYLILHPGWWAVIAIRDSSPGLSEDVHQVLMADQADPAAGDMGPGLKMGEVRLMVESMGGAIWATQPQQGTEVWLAFPLT
jgi:signal transduction histidine kinase/FixJ family two-component response regulator